MPYLTTLFLLLYYFLINPLLAQSTESMFKDSQFVWIGQIEADYQLDGLILAGAVDTLHTDLNSFPLHYT
ncbi:MAG: hypothetical protein KDC54_22225 [Lewinella sp.]|nr:hypothetical protein [Lewinella sp.]